MLYNALILLFLVGLVLFILTLKNPKRRFNKALFKTSDKKKLVVRYVLVLVALFVGIGIARGTRQGIDPVGGGKGEFFGQNVVHVFEPGVTVRVGDSVSIVERADNRNWQPAA